MGKKKSNKLKEPLIQSKHSSSKEEASSLLDTVIEMDNSDQEQLYEAPKSKGLLDYYIVSRVQPGSVKGSMFTLTTAIVGAGIVSIPYVLQQIGWVFGIALIVFGGFVAYFSIYLLVFCSHFTQGTSYYDLACAASGHGLARISQFFICLNLFGSSVGYLVGGAEILPAVIHAFTPKGYDGIWMDRNYLMMVITGSIVLPFSMCRDLSALRFTSMFAVACIAFLTWSAALEYNYFVHMKWAPTIAYQIKHLPMFDLKLEHVLNVVPIVVFAYTCHPNVLPIYLELQQPSPRRIYKVMKRSIGIAVLLYVLLGFFVYFTFGKKTKSNFLINNYRQAPLMVFGSLAFSVAIVVTIPLFIQTLRKNVVTFLAGRSTTLNNWQHYGLSIFLVGMVLLVAVSAGNVAQVLKVLGATTNPIICFVLPTIYLLQLAPREYFGQKVLACLLSTVICCVSVLSLLNQVSPQKFDAMLHH